MVFLQVVSSSKSLKGLMVNFISKKSEDKKDEKLTYRSWLCLVMFDALLRFSRPIVGSMFFPHHRLVLHAFRNSPRIFLGYLGLGALPRWS